LTLEGRPRRMRGPRRLRFLACGSGWLDGGDTPGMPGGLRGTDLDLAEFCDLIVLVCGSGLSRLEVSFAAADDPARVADAIGACFEAALSHDPRVTRDEVPDWEMWSKQAAGLDPRVQVRTPWSDAQPGCQYRVFEA
jgi:hypothetical protein